MKRTNRGFAVYAKFKDSYGNAIRVQESSSAERRAVWVFCHPIDKATGEEKRNSDGALVDWSPHLTKTQAKRLVRALQKFIDEP